MNSNHIANNVHKDSKICAVHKAVRPYAPLPKTIVTRTSGMSNTNSTVKFCPHCKTETERTKHGSCKPCTHIKDAARYILNAEKIKAKVQAWRDANPDMVKAQIASWKTRNPEKVKENSKKFRAGSQGKRRIYEQNRRAKKRGNGGSLSKNISEKLFVLQKGLCACCKKPLGSKFDVDHIVPLILGGENSDGNIQLLRPICNRQKGANHPIDFMQKRGYLL